MRQEIITNAVSIATFIIYLAFLIIHVAIRQIKKKISIAQSLNDIGDFKCESTNVYIAATKNIHRFIIACFVIVSIAVMLEILLKIIGSVGGNNNAVGFTNMNIILAWLICLGGYATTKSFLSLFTYLAKRCDELSKG